MNMTIKDHYGWPVERIIGRPITNIIRLILHTDLVQSCRRPNAPADRPRSGTVGPVVGGKDGV